MRTGVAGLDVDLLGRDHLVAGRQALRSQDVALRAVGEGDQRDERGAVRIVLDPLDGGGHAHLLATLEVDVAERALVSAAPETDRDAAEVVAAAGRRLALGELLDRLALVELTAVDEHELAKARRDRFECLQGHRW